MRALLAFTGSRGDAQPGILLAQALRERGHEVTVALAPNLVAFATEHGVAAVPFGCDTGDLLLAQRTDRRFAARDPRARLRALFDLQRRGVPEALADLRALAPGHDVVVAGMAGEELAESVARSMGVPFAAVHFFPIQPNTAVPVVPTCWAARLPGVVHRRGWAMLARARAAAVSPVLPADPGPATPSVRIQAYEPDLFPGLRTELPGPFTGFPIDVDELLRDRTDGLAITGFGDDADHALRTWLESGTAPIYVGFGSMDVGDPVAFVAMLRAVCAARGRRLLLASGWADISPGIDDRVAIVGQVDHARVLPRCVAAVHHGGAGTTAAALRAGVPQVICSVQADQPYWGQALQRLGLAATTPARTLTGAKLTVLLDLVAAPEVGSRAASWAAGLRTDGVARAADAVEHLVGTATPASIHAVGRSS
ncbi:glycosyltransferase [Nocardia mangyaensis]|uniref:glycosyltransferase n=1 Tax=Nocardia mangyaensis TaxID=2213200 RepID=UPI002676BDF4|nr:glycosyltransferase [Nocardia mangyaensis]MDO3646557.1 glycosyltransferase [Nocardia mangyaensis]